MRARFTLLIGLVWLASVVALSLPGATAEAQTPTPVPLPPPNALLLYDKTTIALINTSAAPISLAGVSFMRAGGAVRFSLAGVVGSLPPGHCFQMWTSAVSFIGKPQECSARDRYISTNRKEFFFWVPDFDGETFRPQLNNSALTICNASAGRCALNIPQGDDAKKTWPVLNPETGLPMPAGMQVAYDANQLWIANMLPDSVMPLKGLRLLYPQGGTVQIWQAPDGPWEATTWDKKALRGGECIVIYKDPAGVVPLLPCTPVGKALRPDQPWLTKFDIMGPREERRSTCGGDQPPTGPVLCVVGG